MSKGYHEGDKVKWEWGDGWGHGEVVKRYEQKVTKEIDGSEVTRDADADEPAYLIKQNDGDEVLKSHSEVQKDS